MSGGGGEPVAQIPHVQCGADQRQQGERRKAAVVKQFPGEPPFQYIARAEGVPLPGRFPTAVIDVGAVEQQRRQLKGRKQQGHCPHHGDAPDAHAARHGGIRNHGQQTYRNRAHVPVDQMGEEGEPKQRAGKRQVTAAPDGAKRQTQRDQQEVGGNGLRKQSAARPRVTAVLDAVEEVSGDKGRQNRRGSGGKWTQAHEPRRRKETQGQ